MGIQSLPLAVHGMVIKSGISGKMGLYMFDRDQSREFNWIEESISDNYKRHIKVSLERWWCQQPLRAIFLLKPFYLTQGGRWGCATSGRLFLPNVIAAVGGFISHRMIHWQINLKSANLFLCKNDVVWRKLNEIVYLFQDIIRKVLIWFDGEVTNK